MKEFHRISEKNLDLSQNLLLKSLKSKKRPKVIHPPKSHDTVLYANFKFNINNYK